MVIFLPWGIHRIIRYSSHPKRIKPHDYTSLGPYMPPKKKEDAKGTCDAGTDLPEPFEFDLFDVDGCKLIEDWNMMPPLACQTLKMLKSQNTTGASKVIKDKVIEKIEQLI